MEFFVKFRSSAVIFLKRNSTIYFSHSNLRIFKIQLFAIVKGERENHPSRLCPFDVYVIIVNVKM